MAARWLDIARKQRRSLGFHASIADFAPGDAEAARPETILRNPDLSLYCLDNTRREAIFVLLPASIDLTAAAFVYKQQYDEALRLFALPYADFLRLAAALPAVDRFIMAYMTGRSGSTLLTHAFNRLDGVVSLSEPDGPVGLVLLQRDGALPPAEMRALLDAMVRFLFRTADNRMPPVCALKMRSELMQLADLIQATYPQARNLFLYRDAVGWVGSMYRIFMRLGAAEVVTLQDARDDFEQAFCLDTDHLLTFLGRAAGELALVEFLALWWLGIIEHYLAAVDRGLPIAAVRFADISSRPTAALGAIFEVCGLERARARQAAAVLDTDAQAGTPLARAVEGEAHLRLSGQQCALIEAIVARHPAIRDAALILPHTLCVD